MFDGTFHTYGVMITTDWIIDYFDGKELARFPMNDYFRTPLYLVVTLAMYPGEVAQASGNYDMVIDYVKAYVSGQVITGTDASQTLTGTALNDRLAGLDGNDTLIGGNGNDMLFGGAGRDAFLFNSAPTLANSDVIGDFNHADDVIQLENSIFKGMGSGTLNPKYFCAGSKANDANDHIIYNAATGGALYYDSDGTGPRAQVMFATITNHAQAGLAYDDFVLV
jgi:Ca2+-binding RTX toxin-like protein